MIQSSGWEKMIQVSNDSEFRSGKNDSGFKQKMIQVGKNEFRFQMIQRSALFCKTENDSGSRYNSVSTSSRRTSLHRNLPGSSFSEAQNTGVDLKTPKFPMLAALHQFPPLPWLPIGQTVPALDKNLQIFEPQTMRHWRVLVFGG